MMNMVPDVVRCPHDNAICVSLCPLTKRNLETGEWRCQREDQGIIITQGLTGAIQEMLSDPEPVQIEHPDYYGGDSVYETIKVAEAWGFDQDVYLFMVLKYISRAGKKTGESVEADLKKAKFYLDRRIERI